MISIVEHVSFNNATLKINLPTTDKYRTCVEMSYMSNNDEYFIESKQIITEPPSKRSGFDDPKIVFSRPVYQCELENSKLTESIDAIYKLKNYFKIYELLHEYGKDISFSSSLAGVIGQHYYDCMSGGLPVALYELLIILANHPSVDKNTYVYSPNITIQDFINTEKIY